MMKNIIEIFTFVFLIIASSFLIASENTIQDSTGILYEEPPQPITLPPIHFDDIEGTVIVKTFIDDGGNVKETIILKAMPNTGQNEFAVETIRNTQFTPAKKNGEPIGVWITIPVNFVIKDYQHESTSILDTMTPKQAIAVVLLFSVSIFLFLK